MSRGSRHENRVVDPPVLPARALRRPQCIALGFAAVLCCGLARPAQPDAEPVTLAAVVDGDTVKVRSGPRELTVRLIGIDAPEHDDPEDLPQYLGAEASAELERSTRCPGLSLVRDPDAGLDRYQRTLAYLQCGDGTDLGEALLERGLARVFRRSEHRRRTRYLAAQEQARSAGRGVWAEGGLAEWRWIERQKREEIRLVPLADGLFAVGVRGWVRLGVTARELSHAVWVARRALGLAGRRPADADALLQRERFRRVKGRDRAPRRPIRRRGCARRRGFRPASPDRTDSDRCAARTPPRAAPARAAAPDRRGRPA